MWRKMKNRKIEILTEIMGIYKKYFDACETMGTIAMSPADKIRLQELEKELHLLSEKD
jgi:hypothetical protein